MNNRLNIAFFGSSDFVLPILESIKNNQDKTISQVALEQLDNLNQDYEPKLTKETIEGIQKINKVVNLQVVVSQPDRKNREKVVSNPVSSYCHKNGINLYQPEKINEDLDGFDSEVKELDIAITASYGQLISNAVIEKAKYGFVNWHPSLLPKYRGATPMQTAIANGDKKIGLSWINVAKKMDAGEVYLQIEQDLDNSIDIEKLAENMGKLGEKTWAIAVCLKILSLEDSQDYKPIVQDENQVVICKMLSKEDAYVDYNSVAAEKLYNHYRAYKFFPKTKINCPRFGEIKIIEVNGILTNEQTQSLKLESEVLFDKNDGSSWIQLKKGKEVINLLKCLEGYVQITKIGLQDGKQIELKGYDFK